IVVGGIASPTAAGSDLAVARYEADGALDATFGVGGIVTTDVLANDFVTDLVLQPDGDVVTVGYATPDTGSIDSAVTVVARYDAGGAPDPGFGTGGLATIGLSAVTIGGGLALAPDGSLIVVGNDIPGQLQGFVARLATNGSLDPAFDGDGVALLP